jgi:hypothetical protein
MRRFTYIASMMFAAGLAATADSSAAQAAKASVDTPEARSRCLGLSYEVSAMMDQVEKDQDAAIKEAGANPTPEQAAKLKELESDYVTMAYIWADLEYYFKDADAPSDDVKLDFAFLDGEELSEELNICDAIIDEMDKPGN